MVFQSYILFEILFHENLANIFFLLLIQFSIIFLSPFMMLNYLLTFLYTLISNCTTEFNRSWFFSMTVILFSINVDYFWQVSVPIWLVWDSCTATFIRTSSRHFGSYRSLHHSFERQRLVYITDPFHFLMSII